MRGLTHEMLSVFGSGRGHATPQPSQPKTNNGPPSPVHGRAAPTPAKKKPRSSWYVTKGGRRKFGNPGRGSKKLKIQSEAQHRFFAVARQGGVPGFDPEKAKAAMRQRKGLKLPQHVKLGYKASKKRVAAHKAKQRKKYPHLS